VQSITNCVLTQKSLCVLYFTLTCVFIVALTDHIKRWSGANHVGVSVAFATFRNASLFPATKVWSVVLRCLWMSPPPLTGPFTYRHWKKSRCVMSGIRNVAKRILTYILAWCDRAARGSRVEVYWTLNLLIFWTVHSHCVFLTIIITINIVKTNKLLWFDWTNSNNILN
jgi:hypothetical protein